MRVSGKEKQLNENEKFLFSCLYQKEQGHRLHFINVLHLPHFGVKPNTKGQVCVELCFREGDTNLRQKRYITRIYGSMLSLLKVQYYGGFDASLSDFMANLRCDWK